MTDRTVRDTLRLVPFIAAAIGVLGLLMPVMGPFAFILALAVVTERRVIVRGARTFHEFEKERVRRKNEATLAAARKRERIEHAAERLEPSEKDCIDNLPVADIARVIAESGQPTVTNDALMSLGLTQRGASAFRQALLAGEFLIYPVTIDGRTPALGGEPIAYMDNSAKRATTLHPTLMAVPTRDRATVIANAIRRARALPTDPDPIIKGEPSILCRFTNPVDAIRYKRELVDVPGARANP